jgi:ABC-type transport system involved in cytochrome c biogenesis permease subunit
MTDDRRDNPRGSPFRFFFRLLASLQLAVGLIAVYALIVLPAATFIESQHGREAARFAVYGTSWFTAIHVLLGVNVLCAMLARLPWRRRQIGFLVTHAGILVLLVGCALTRWNGIEAAMAVFEGHGSHIAYEETLHFELDVTQKASKEETISVPFEPGPFNWSDYRTLPWFPWCLGHRSRGIIYDAGGVTLDVLDYSKEPNPAARVRLTVDGKTEDFDLAASSAETLPTGLRRILVGRDRRVAISLRQDVVDLGFQVYLHRFRRKLDPGSGMPSHYSSRVDFLDRSDPPKKLREDALITLNAPVDFTDPRTGRAYRLFQSSFDGPWTPGSPKFDALVGANRTRDQVYQSVLSVNYDPGRWPKYIGSLLIVLGIAIVYYLRGVRIGRGLADSGKFILGIAVLFSIAGNAHAASDRLEWTAWQHLPVFTEGRVAPLDTFARATVESICGRATPTLRGPDATSRKFAAPELLFAWLVEPESWESVRFLPGGRSLREYLGMSLVDSEGRSLQGISPSEVDQSDLPARRLADLRRRADAEGKRFHPSALEKEFDRLLDAYGGYRSLTSSPRNTMSWSNQRGGQTAKALQTLIGSLQVARRIEGDDRTREQMVQVVEAWQKLVKALHAGQSSEGEIEPAAAAFSRAADQLAARLASPDDAPMTALGANLRHQAAELHLSLYDDGKGLRLVPGLIPGALEENRTPDDDASPWLGFQAMINGSDDLLKPYPRSELLAVCKAFAEAKAAYLDHKLPDRPERFAAAMQRFAESLRALAEKIQPLRDRLQIRHRDRTLIDATAYPLPGSTAAEVLYGRLNPFFWSWLVSLVATLCLFLAVGRWRKPLFWLGVAILVIGQVSAAVGMGFRWWITGLIPLTGMFETVEFVAIYAALLGLWFAMTPLGCRISQRENVNRMDLVLERRPFALAGAVVGFTAAVLAYYAPATVMHRNIGSVTPILRDDFWLAVHVVTIMASYASAAIAWILGNVALSYYLFGRYNDLSHPTDCRSPESCRILAGFIYTAIQITVLLLAAGTILGALWADKAWGHFWGWDPKEVWALVSLLAYILILHTRYLGWSRDFGMAFAAVFGFTAVLFTWYGVNFVLGSGMHAYGSGAGGAWAVTSAAAFQWIFLLAAAVRYLTESLREAERRYTSSASGNGDSARSNIPSV